MSAQESNRSKLSVLDKRYSVGYGERDGIVWVWRPLSSTDTVQQSVARW